MGRDKVAGKIYVNDFMDNRLHGWLHNQLRFELTYLHHHHNKNGKMVWHPHRHHAYEPHNHPDLEWNVHEHEDLSGLFA